MVTVGDILKCKDMLMNQRGTVYRFLKKGDYYEIYNKDLNHMYTTWSTKTLKSSLMDGNIEFVRNLDKRSNMYGW